MRNTVALYTLGCKLNHVETSALGQQFVERGFEIVPFGEQADVVVINSCTVTTAADAECRQIVRRAHRTSPNAHIIVTGCYAEREPETLASMEGVTAVIGNGQKHHIVQQIVAPGGVAPSGVPREASNSSKSDSSWSNFFPARSLGEDGRTRAFLKLQDGCDYVCTFCTIPAVRGEARAMSFDRVIEQIDILSESGCGEVVLTGVNLGEYKAPSGERFIDVLRAFHIAQPKYRVRISSIEPNTVNNDIIDLMATSNVIAPHLHMPLQSGSAEILRLMKRRYTPERYRGVVERVVEAMPHACIGIDVITGFPGETDELFNETLQFLHSFTWSYLHIFTFSERPGTPASTMKGMVPQRIRKERTHVLEALSKERRAAFDALHGGRAVSFLPEHFDEKRGEWSGWTDNYIRTTMNGSADMPKQLYDLELTSP